MMHITEPFSPIYSIVNKLHKMHVNSSSGYGVQQQERRGWRDVGLPSTGSCVEPKCSSLKIPCPFFIF